MSRTNTRPWSHRYHTAGIPASLISRSENDHSPDTAATVLLLLEVPLRTVMSIMGWSSVDMAARYQHITDAIRQKVAGQVDEVIWQSTSLVDQVGMVPVRREALAVVLSVVDIGLAHSGAEALTDLEEALAHLRAALSDEAISTTPFTASDGN